MPTWLTLVLGSALVLAVVWASVARAQCECPGAATEAIGHRGTGSNRADNPFPENTIASFEQAVLEGATMVELDVQLTQDGVLVVMHDDTVNRTTDGSGCVAELDLEAIRALDADGEPVPTLEDVLGAVSVDLNIEIKVADGEGCPPTDKPALAAELARVLAASAGSRRIVISSFDLDQLLAVRAADAELRLAYLFTGIDGFGVALEQGMDAHPLAINARAREVRAHQEAGLAVRPYTVNDEATMRRLFEVGVDGIVSDEPQLVIATRDAFCDGYTCDPPDAGAPDGGSSDGGGGGCSVSRRSTPGWLGGGLLLLLYRRRRISRAQR